MKLSIHLVTWNGEKYIPSFFDSLTQQTFQDFKVYAWDNGSNDGSVALIESALPNNSFFHKNKENIGFAKAHNELYAQSDEEYFLVANQDIFLEADCLEKLVAFLDEHQEAGGVAPRLMRWNFGRQVSATDGGEDSLPPSLRYGRASRPSPCQGEGACIDSLGLKVFRSRRVVELYQGKKWEEVQGAVESNNGALEVFGVSGALALFRRSAIHDVAFGKDEFFDALYGSYKEDVDLAYRLQSCRWKSYVLLDAAASHDRTGRGPEQRDDLSAARNKKGQGRHIQENSYRNHLLTLYKNEYRQNFLLDFPWIFWYEVKKFVWFALFERTVLLNTWSVCSAFREEVKKKRIFIQKNRRVSYREMREWWK